MLKVSFVASSDHKSNQILSFSILFSLQVLDCFQLNTPPPVMTVCPAPPNCPDPFRSGPHPHRDLGSSVCRMPSNCLHLQPSHVVVQLTQEEDQAITNLLKLHYQSPLGGSETFSAAGTDVSCVTAPKSSLSDQRPVNSSLSCDVQHQGVGWSDTELEAANTLLNGFILSEEGSIWGQAHNKPAELEPEPLPHQHPAVSPVSFEPQHRSEALVTTQAKDNSFGCVGQNEDPSCSIWSAEDRSVSGDSTLRGRTVSDSEGDAVQGLLSLGDSWTGDTGPNM